MKVSSIQIPKIVKNIMVTAPLLLATTTLRAQQQNLLQEDIFVKTATGEPVSLPSSINVPESLEMSPELIVGGKVVYPAIVVTLSDNRLYYYDPDTNLYDVFSVALGKSSTPTKPGLKVINKIEQYPYLDAPKSTKRYKNPADYGTYLLNLSNVDSKTGEITGSDGQFIHGTFSPETIGQNVSKGCIRVHNEALEFMLEALDTGQYVLIKE